MQKPGWRWGEKYKGRWQGGWKAPGGWGAYKRPVRGWTLPSYWFSGGFWISDWTSWGLSSPPYGYNWVRYYDDAVLVDQYGRVWDSVSGVDWDRGDGYYDDGGEYAEEDDGYGAGYDAPGYADAPPPPPGYAPPPPVVYAAPAPGMRCVANCYPAPGYGYGYYGAPVTTTVVIQSAPVVTTTTTVTEVVYSGRKVVRRAPSKQLYRAPARVKTKTCYCR
ncbi:RcnB family protein [Sphingomonas sp. MG17]|uniref:RcnB family protein n=2 Tax=Sphingomonas tagetis TaxID=2949092 RepID=A0A9X2KQJ1_9SPHN|nr:RcnB family protein [Sphingomonas tagetis]